MKTVLTLCTALLVAGAGAYAQTTPQVAYFPFDDGTATAQEGDPDLNGSPTGSIGTACGVRGGAASFDGTSTYVTFASGTLLRRFEQADFGISFYFHPTGSAARQTLIRKKRECETEESLFSLVYLPQEDALQLDLAQNPSRRAGGPDALIPLDPDACWQHVVVSRIEGQVAIFVNGTRAATFSTGGRANISNDFPIELARAGCPGTEQNFQGFVDELRFFGVGLRQDAVDTLYLNTERVTNATRQQVIDAGAEATIALTSTCAETISWTPTATVVGPADGVSVVVSPATTTAYTVRLEYADSPCAATDSALIQVFDPNEFDCTQLLLPRAFTPNGDGLNDGFSISNAATLQTFTTLEIYDRWGNRVFATGTKTEAWDGTYAGEPAAPGMYLWRVAFGCQDEALDETGSVVLIR